MAATQSCTKHYMIYGFSTFVCSAWKILLWSITGTQFCVQHNNIFMVSKNLKPQQASWSLQHSLVSESVYPHFGCWSTSNLVEIYTNFSIKCWWIPFMLKCLESCSSRCSSARIAMLCLGQWPISYKWVSIIFLSVTITILDRPDYREHIADSRITTTKQIYHII